MRVIFVIFEVMTALEYRQEAIKWLQSGDENLARLVHTFIKNYRDDNSSDWWETIEASEKADIEEGLKQADEQKLVPHDEVMSQYGKYL